LNVKFENINNPTYEFIIYNSIGQIVESFVLNENNTTINTETYKQGFYFYTLLNNNIPIQTGKIILK
jgi:hypothetical protein